MDGLPHIKPGQLSQIVAEKRGNKNQLSPTRPVDFIHEIEWVSPDISHTISTLFLLNRECPWRCSMCDLWVNTSDRPVTSEEIISQIDYALSKLPESEWLKLYNSGSFFDAGAIPTSSWNYIADRANRYSHLIIENHPRLTTPRIMGFLDLLEETSLEIAMGLESANPRILQNLNKRFDLDDFRRACQFLKSQMVIIRAFVLIEPPFSKSPEAALNDLITTCEFCNTCGVDNVGLIPSRGGTGFMLELERSGDFREPGIDSIESGFEICLSHFHGITSLDLWDITRFMPCQHCRDARIERFKWMNRHQKIMEPVDCRECVGVVKSRNQGGP